MRLWLVRLINPHPAGPAPIPELPLRISLALFPATVVGLPEVAGPSTCLYPTINECCGVLASLQSSGSRQEIKDACIDNDAAAAVQAGLVWSQRWEMGTGRAMQRWWLRMAGTRSMQRSMATWRLMRTLMRTLASPRTARGRNQSTLGRCIFSLLLGPEKHANSSSVLLSKTAV